MAKNTLVALVKSYLEKAELNFETSEDNQAFFLSFDMEYTQIDVKIACDTEVDRLFVAGFSTIKVSKDKRPAILEKINKIHWDCSFNAHLLINEESKAVMSYAVLYTFEGLAYDVFVETLSDVTSIIDTNFKELMQIIVNPDLCEIVMKMQGSNTLTN